MIKKLDELFSKINKLERELKTVSAAAEEFSSVNYFCKQTKFLNFSCVKESKLKVASIEIVNDKNLLFECYIDIVLPTSQGVEYAILLGESVIFKGEENFEIGQNQIKIIQKTKPQKRGIVDIYIVIKPLLNKMLVLEDCLLNVWGCRVKEIENKYSAKSLGENYAVGFLKDELLYYKIITKQKRHLAADDFEFAGEALSFDFGYDSTNDGIILCRIDVGGNLYIDNFKIKNTIFLSDEAKDVCAVNVAENLYVFFIKNGKCFCAQVDNFKVVNIQEICYNYIIKKCRIKYNDFVSNFVILLELENGKNVMLETVVENNNFAENLKAKFLIVLEEIEV